jgi:hypothetical protein
MSGSRMVQRPSRVLSLSFAIVACAVLGPGRSLAEDAPAPAGSSTAAAANATAASLTDPMAAPAADAAGFKVNVDPATGRFLETPAAEPDAGAALPRAEQPLVEEPSAIPGGGVHVRITDQRLNAAMKADTAPDGSTHVGCDEPAK